MSSESKKHYRGGFSNNFLISVDELTLIKMVKNVLVVVGGTLAISVVKVSSHLCYLSERKFAACFTFSKRPDTSSRRFENMSKLELKLRSKRDLSYL